MVIQKQEDLSEFRVSQVYTAGFRPELHSETLSQNKDNNWSWPGAVAQYMLLHESQCPLISQLWLHGSVTLGIGGGDRVSHPSFRVSGRLS